MDNAVKSARPREGCVQGSGPIGGGHHNHACVVLKAVHLRQQLVDGLHALCSHAQDFISSEMMPTLVLLSSPNPITMCVLSATLSVKQQTMQCACSKTMSRGLPMR